MNDAVLSLARLPYDDSACRILLSASNGTFAGELEFYSDAPSLLDFAQRLIEFPRSASDEARLEVGEQDGNSACYLLLRALVIDRAGHTAMEIVIDNHEQGHRHADATFFIPCEVASLNQLGRKICGWLEQPDNSLVWVACNA
jgi:hypothetical protein